MNRLRPAAVALAACLIAAPAAAKCATTRIDYDGIYKNGREELHALAGHGHGELADGCLRRTRLTGSPNGP